jgi:hypothetical protein
MAYFDRTHGDSKPVFQSDTLDPTYTSPAATGTPVNLAGPHQDFFGIDLGADPSGQLGTSGAVEAVIKAIQQLGTVYTYQVQASASANNMSIAVYPVGAWTANSGSAAPAGNNLQLTIRALGTVNGFDLSGATVTNVGFKLAAS